MYYFECVNNGKLNNITTHFPGFCLGKIESVDGMTKLRQNLKSMNLKYTYEYIESGITIDQIIETYVNIGSLWLTRETLNKLVDSSIGTFMDSINK